MVEGMAPVPECAQFFLFDLGYATKISEWRDCCAELEKPSAATMLRRGSAIKAVRISLGKRLRYCLNSSGGRRENPKTNPKTNPRNPHQIGAFKGWWE